MDMQTRFATLTETRAVEGVIEGYASVFGVVDTYGTTVEAGAFKRSLETWQKRGESPGLFMQHDGSMPLGVWEELSEDAKGLKVRGRLVKSAMGDHAAALFEAGAIRGLSIGFMPRKWREDGKVIRFEEVELVEVSMFTRPANAKAKATLRSDMTVREIEDALANGTLPPLPRSEAKALLADGFKALRSERDAGQEEQTPNPLTREIISWVEQMRGTL
jgi:HK97 family phage prohead protease